MRNAIALSLASLSLFGCATEIGEQQSQVIGQTQVSSAHLLCQIGQYEQYKPGHYFLLVPSRHQWLAVVMTEQSTGERDWAVLNDLAFTEYDADGTLHVASIDPGNPDWSSPDLIDACYTTAVDRYFDIRPDGTGSLSFNVGTLSNPNKSDCPVVWLENIPSVEIDCWSY